MPKPAIVATLLLVASVLAFAGLAYPAVPVSTTQTIIQSSTTSLDYYESRTATEITQYITSRYVPTTETFVMIGNWEFLYNQYNQPVTLEYIPYGPTVTITNTTLEPFMTYSSYAEQYTVAVPYHYTATSSITVTSTNLVPASALLGLTDGVFSTVALLVIGNLFILSAWIALKPKMTTRREQPMLRHFETGSD